MLPLSEGATVCDKVDLTDSDFGIALSIEMSMRGQDDEAGGAASASGDRGGAAEGVRASTLDLPREELRELARMMGGLALDYMESAASLPVFPETSAAQLGSMFRGPLPTEGVGLEKLERDCAEIIGHSRHNGHPRMFGYVASPATPVGAFATLLASALNSNVTSWRSAPAPTEIEHVTIGWLAELIGYKGAGRNEGAGGLLTSGGSMANLDALFTRTRTKSPTGETGWARHEKGARGVRRRATSRGGDCGTRARR